MVAVLTLWKTGTSTGKIKIVLDLMYDMESIFCKLVISSYALILHFKNEKINYKLMI